MRRMIEKFKSALKNTHAPLLRTPDEGVEEIIGKIKGDPLSPELYRELGDAYLRRGLAVLATACYRSANYFGAGIDYIEKTKGKLPDKNELPTDQYVRFRAVAERVNLYERASVLDVGGGHGYLGLFIPDHDYMLADLETTGLSSLPLVFDDNCFDIVCSTDTLEHIPRGSRRQFIEELVRVANKEVNIVVPTALPAELPDYNRFFYDMTGAFQTKEHIEYGVPTTKELRGFIEGCKDVLKYDISPCGSLTNLALLLLNYLIDSKNRDKLSEIYRYFNTNFYNEIKEGRLAIGHHVKIEKAGGNAR
jgi:hypothetical protein